MSIKTDALVAELEKRVSLLETRVEFLKSVTDSIWKAIMEMKNQNEVRVTQPRKKYGRSGLSDHQ